MLVTVLFGAVLGLFDPGGLRRLFVLLRTVVGHSRMFLVRSFTVQGGVAEHVARRLLRPTEKLVEEPHLASYFGARKMPDPANPRVHRIWPAESTDRGRGRSRAGRPKNPHVADLLGSAAPVPSAAHGEEAAHSSPAASGAGPEAARHTEGAPAGRPAGDRRRRSRRGPRDRDRPRGRSDAR